VLKSDWTLRAAYAECRRLARKHYENFPVASYLVPRQKRDALAAIYAFARSADDFADEYRVEDATASQQPRLDRLADWRRKLNACYAGHPDHPVFVALADAARRFDLSQEHFENLLRAFESDVLVSRHENFASLLNYCSCSANPVGRLVLELFTPKERREPALFELSDNICTALQLANFWQDVRVDLERDRVYLPLDELQQFGSSLEIVRTYLPKHGRASVAKPGENWNRFLDFQIQRTQALFMRGMNLPELAPRELRVQLRLTWLGGMEILSKIEAVEYDVFRRRPALSRMDFLKLYFRARGRHKLASEAATHRVQLGGIANEP
jgi:phytoene synthase